MTTGSLSAGIDPGRGASKPEGHEATPSRRRGLTGVPRARGSVRARVLRRLAPRLLERVDGGRLTIVDVDGATLVGPGRSDAGPLRGELVIERADFWRRTARSGHMGFSESFVAGDWHSPDLPSLLELLARSTGHAARRGTLSRLRALQRARPVLLRRNDARRARAQIGYHYDLGNDFYEKFLDPTMAYSSALFDQAGLTLEQAQRAKYDSICRRLGLEPGMRVLEIGCGWGGFATYAARTYGVHVMAVTISSEQHQRAKQVVVEQGLQDRVDVRLCDYRAIEGRFDRIASIEMLEAVGAREYPNFFRTIERQLDRRGLACVQVIGFNEREHQRLLRVDGWLRRYIFPGGMCPSVGALTSAMTKAGDLQLVSLTEIGRHYIPTLASWRQSLLEQREEIIALGYDEAFLRGWEYYLAYCEAGFRCGIARCMQLVFAPSLADSALPDPALPGYPVEQLREWRDGE